MIGRLRRFLHVSHAAQTSSEAWPLWMADGPRLSARAWLAVVGTALVASILMTWPIPAQLASGVMTTPARVDNPDLGQNIWNIWHLQQTWTQPDLLWSTVVAAPLSVNLVSQSYGIVNLLIVLPIAAVAGPVVAANCILLLGFWAGIVLMTVAAYRLNHSLPLAFVAACVFVLTPAHLKNVEWAADENAAVHWLVLLFLVTVWWLRAPGAWRSAALAGVLVLATLASGYYGLFGAVFVGVLALTALIQRADRAWRWRVVLTGGAAAAVWAGLMVLLTGNLLDPQQRAGVVWNAAVTEYGSAGLRDWQMRQTIWLHVVSLVDLLVPTPNHPLWGQLAWVAQRPFPSEMGGYLGAAVLVLVGWTVWRTAAVRPLVWIAAACLSLAGGLNLTLWYDQPFAALPGPLWILDVFGVFRNATRPGLFLLFAWIPLTLLTGYGLAQLRARWQQVLVCAILLLDFAPPVWVSAPPQTSPAARLVPPGSGTVVTLPIGKNDQQPLLDQLCHQQPIVAGYLARTPTYPVEIDPLRVPADAAAATVLPVDGITMLQNLGVRTVIARDVATQAWFAALPAGRVTTRGRAGGATVYALGANPIPVAMAGSGWWEPEGSGQTQWRWTQGAAEVIFVADSPRRVSLGYDLSALAALESTWTLDGRLIARVAVPAQPAATARVVSFTIPRGRSVLRISAPTIADPHGRQVALAFTRLAVQRAVPVRANSTAALGVQQPPVCFSPIQSLP